MRKIIIMLLSVCILVSMPGCGTRHDESKVQEDVSADDNAENPKSAIAKNSGSDAAKSENHILIAWFSLNGNTEYPNGIDASTSASIVVNNDSYGTTEYVARMIQNYVGGDLHFIKTKELYPSDFEELKEQNHREMADEFLPELEKSNLDMSQYDTVFIGYPVWATEAPQAISSFLNEYDMSGKTVIPFCTHDGYGAGKSYATIQDASYEATMLDGLALEASDVPFSEAVVTGWLDRIGFEKKGTAISVTIGDTVLDGVIYDTALAQEIMEYFPLTISMSGYGGREYYGGVDFYPSLENLIGGGNTFENGDITYCEAHHNMAVFYAQTDHPILSVDVIPIGKVTSDLSVFETLDTSEEITFSLANKRLEE